MADIYSKLTPWQKTQVARHAQRPHFLEYAAQLFEEFTPLAGDRKFAEDEAIQAGLGRFAARPSPSSARKRATTPSRASSTISAARGRKATARRSASWKWPTASACRSSH
jgi:acetyl-CoA carboxylase carboxyl transferase subunit alpha